MLVARLPWPRSYFLQVGKESERLCENDTTLVNKLPFWDAFLKQAVLSQMVMN